MLNPLFKIILLGSSLMSMARCSVSDLINGGESSKKGDFFAVKVNNSSVDLVVSETNLLDSYQDSLAIKNSDMVPLEQNTLEQFLPHLEEIDSQDTSYTYGANMSPDGSYRSLYYFKYTFFIRNQGLVTARYKWSINFQEKGSGTSMLHVLRVMLFENNEFEEGAHQYEVYAKEAADGSQELISTPEYGYAQKFESDSTLASSIVSGFQRADMMRYTVVIWIEGNDPECTNDYYSDGFKDNYSFEFDINAKEQD